MRHPLRQWLAVWFDRRRRPDAIVGVVDQARHRAALHPSGLPAGEWSPRAHASHLKAQTSRPPAANAAEQQERFDTFRRHYNEERPHEALGQRPPHEVYTPSQREMPDRIGEPWYDADHQVRRVRSSGEISWKGERVFVTEALIGEPVGIAELETGDHVVRFCHRDIGLIDCHGRFRRFARPVSACAKPIPVRSLAPPHPARAGAQP